ncbi:MAG: hypothetical protein H6558_22050 [Lewinellaceae bacterium]|nr:hypothetical protein [Lewinellaceae bacterium]MCB9287454.1 hypothetical protein [Lewinellaceae bacterium]
MPKRKMTPFARFLIVMIFVVPLAYFGASWYNGEDPLNVRQYLGLDTPQKSEEVSVKADEKESEKNLQLRIEELEKKLQECEKELDELKAQAKNQE